MLVVAVGCPPATPPSPDDGDGTAAFVGSAACSVCHGQIGALHGLHGHSQIVKAVEDGPPLYPVAEAEGVPDPPAGFEWNDISYVIGGYLKTANFLDRDGFMLTDGTAGAPAQYNLTNGPAGVPAEFVPFMADRTTPLPYSRDCFGCHTTGPASLAASGGRHQDGLPGILGTWAEAGVQCEACHGPGSIHVDSPSSRNIIVETSAQLCARCHGEDGPTGQLSAVDGFLTPYQQYLEVQASPHEGFTCSVCHDPHASVTYDRPNGIRNACTTCHASQNMAFHFDRVYVFGDYVEHLSCESCHMPPAAMLASGAVIEGDSAIRGRVGDTRTHVVYIDTLERDFTRMLTADGMHVRTDAEGKARITLDYVCQRCHHGQGSAFPLTLGGAASIGRNIHEKVQERRRGTR